jgi:type I restriction enzyme R subunit
LSPHAWSEDQLVEQPAIGLFVALGWQTASALDETFGAVGTFGRETRGEVVLVNRLRASRSTVELVRHTHDLVSMFAIRE